MRIEDHLGEDCFVTKGLHQNCVLSPILFSLYIDSLVSELKGSGCGVVQC